MYDRLLQLLFEQGQSEFNFDDAKEQERKDRVRAALDRTPVSSDEGNRKKKKAAKKKATKKTARRTRSVYNPDRDVHQGRGSMG